MVAVAMILRVWALWNQSRFVLGTLLAFLAMEAISFFALYVILSIGDVVPVKDSCKFNQVCLILLHTTNGVPPFCWCMSSTGCSNSTAWNVCNGRLRELWTSLA